MSLFCIVGSIKTPTELVSVFVLMHCQNSSAESVQRQNMKALNANTHAHTHSLSTSQTHTCKHTLSIFLCRSQTNLHAHADTLIQPPLVIYSLCCVRVCCLTCLPLNVHSLCASAEEAYACMRDHLRVCPVQNMSVFTCLDSHPSIRVYFRKFSCHL